MKNHLHLVVAGALLLSGCASIFKSEEDVIVWKSASVSAEWVERQVAHVMPEIGTRVMEVGVAPQMNETGRGDHFRGKENFLIAAAFNKRTGAFSAEWGYAPNPEHGHNGLQLVFDSQDMPFAKTGMCFGKHPVRYEISPDYRQLTMLWGARFENRGQSAHRVTWLAEASR